MKAAAPVLITIISFSVVYFANVYYLHDDLSVVHKVWGVERRPLIRCACGVNVSGLMVRQNCSIFSE